MKLIQIFGLIGICILTACTVPTATDFQSANRPMSSDEMISLWRFTRHASFKECLDTTQAHAERLEYQMEPLFLQLIPQIFSDIKEGKLTMQDENDMSNLHEEPITDLPLRMNEMFETNWQNLDPFMEFIHISQRRKKNTKGFDSEGLELFVIGVDLEGKLPEKYLGSVRIADLEALEYTIDFEGVTYGLMSYLEKCVEFGYPIRYRTTEMQNGLRTLEIAFTTKEMLLQGEWASIEWLGDEPNLSGKNFVVRPAAELKQFTGKYTVEPSSDNFLTKGEEPITVLLEIEEDYLNAGWSNMHRYFQYHIFPSNDDIFFTVHGDIIEFSTDKDGKRMFTITQESGKAIVGKME